MKRRTLWASLVVVAVLAAAPLAYVTSASPFTLLGDAMPAPHARAPMERVMHWLARPAIATWRHCPSNAASPESLIGFVVNGNLAPPVGDSRERTRGLVASLMDAGCDINAYSRFGATPLMNAALSGDAWAVDMLLSLRADARLKARAPDAEVSGGFGQRRVGLTALDLARLGMARLQREGTNHAAVIASLERARP